MLHTTSVFFSVSKLVIHLQFRKIVMYLSLFFTKVWSNGVMEKKKVFIHPILHYSVIFEKNDILLHDDDVKGGIAPENPIIHQPDIQNGFPV